MKTIKNLLVIAIIAIATFSCKNETQPEVKTVETEIEEINTTLDPNATYAKAEFKIEGMTCAMGCAKVIEKKMAKMEGVKSAKVDFERQLAMVEYDEAKVTPSSLESTVTSVADSYKVKDMKTVETFTAKKSCGADCKKACCAGKDKKSCTVKCSPDCTKKDCAKCAAKTAECKKKCDAKAKDGKTACTKDSKKACCTGKDKKSCTTKCSPDCTKKDCAKCTAKTVECKKKCDAKAKDRKTACAKDCKKACCAKA